MVETFKAPVLDDKGSIIGTTGYSRDITERKQMEISMHSLALHREALFFAVPEIIMEVDKNKIYKWANKQWVRVFRRRCDRT